MEEEHEFDFSRAINGKIEGEIEGEKVSEHAVDNMSLAYGQILDVRNGNKYDVMYMEATTQTGEKHRLLFSAGTAAELVLNTSEWLDGLIAGDPCPGCGQTHGNDDEPPSEPSSAKNMIDTVDSIKEAMRELVREDEENDRLW